MDVLRRTASNAALTVATLLIGTVVPDAAHAGGAAYPGGPIICDVRDGPPGSKALGAPVARLTTSYAFTSTTLLFGDGRRADLSRHAIFGGVQIPLTRSGAVTLQTGAGGIAGGTLTHGAARNTIGPRLAAFAGLAWRVVDGRAAVPFVQLTATLSATHALTRTDERGTRTDGSASPRAQPETPRFTALDLRVGAVAGKTIGDVLTPTLLRRRLTTPRHNVNK